MEKARAKQVVPPGHDWSIWFLLSGRGFGKTRTICEEGAWRGLWRPMAKNEADAYRIAVVAPTFSDLRKISFEGNSGLLGIIPENLMWKQSRKLAYNRNNQELRLWNGTLLSGYSAEEPDRLRGSQFHLALCEELASWRYEEAFEQLEFCLRLGDYPQMLIATTPKPTPLIKGLVTRAERHPQDVVLVKGSTFENVAGLGKRFIASIKARFDGTRMGRQELYAEVLDDTPGALWTVSMIDRNRISPTINPVTHEIVWPELPDFTRIVVAIDPMAGEPDKDERPGVGPESGIVVAARGTNGHAYVLDDISMSGRPREWAQAAVSAYKKRRADCIVAEINNGGLMVEETIRTVDSSASYRAVTASRGKITRAEPISSLYERNLVHHVGTFAALESQMTTYIAGNKSPDRMDALVWALTDLMVDETEIPTTMAESTGVSAWDFGHTNSGINEDFIE